MNPLFGKIQNGNIFPHSSNLFEQLNRFISNFRGNPKDKVEELLASGAMSQEQFEQLSQMARQLQGGVSKR